MFTFPSSSARNLLSAIDLRPSLRSLSPDALCQTHVLGHDGDPLRVHRTQIGVLEEADEVRLGRFLKRQQRRGLEPDVDLEVLNNLTNEPLERRLPDEEVGGFLVPTDLSQSNRAGAIPPPPPGFARRRSVTGPGTDRRPLPRNHRSLLLQLPRRLLDSGHGLA